MTEATLARGPVPDSVNGHSVASQCATASCTGKSSSAQFALTQDCTSATRESDGDG